MAATQQGSLQVETKIEDMQFKPVNKDTHGGSLFDRVGRIFMAGMGFLADAYDLFVINIVLLMMKEVDYGVKLTHEMQAQISLMAVGGALTGQIVFGIMGDWFGRRSIFLTTAFLTIFGTIGSAAVQKNQYFTIWQQMMVARFFMGVGIGGEYPMASTITAETSSQSTRGRNLAAVFAMQGVGRIMCAVVLCIVAHTMTDYNAMWRVAVIVGALPMIGATYFRFLPESEHYQQEVASKYDSGERLKMALKLTWLNRWKLVGTAGTWFILDVLFYGNSLFSADVTRAMGTENTIPAKTVQNLIIQCIAMPGYIMAVIFIDRVGRKRLQLFGFAGEATIFLIMAIFQHQLKHMKALFVLCYALTFFFDDFGPNTTTFIIPAEVFPTAARATCHGISAAMGKAGALVGGALFLQIQNMYCPGHNCELPGTPTKLVDKGLSTVFGVCAMLAGLGFLVTWFFIDDRAHDSLTVHSEADDDSPRDIEMSGSKVETRA